MARVRRHQLAELTGTDHIRQGETTHERQTDLRSPSAPRAVTRGVPALLGEPARAAEPWRQRELIDPDEGNSIAEFPWLSVAFVNLPIPIAGVLTLHFIIEKIWLGESPRDDVMYIDAPADLE